LQTRNSQPATRNPQPATIIMYQDLLEKKKAIAVVGLGYVGLPIALEFGKYFKVIGYDIKEDRVEMMKNNIDPSKELESSAFEGKDVTFTANPDDLKEAHFFVVAVPTPVDGHKVPNLKPVIGASNALGKVLKKGDYVIYESTVYPGCTEEDCVPILEELSGLKMGEDFKVGYSPERINPGDKKNTIANIIKIVSGCDDESLEEIAKVYEKIIIPGVYRAETIKVAEAAKVIENTQRDLNISFVNELAIIFSKMGINTHDVINAAGTKWNFIKFRPGLVGGHCIGVDPYYLTYKSKQLGYDPQVILSGRRINDSMPNFVASKTVQKMIKEGKDSKNTKVLVMGITFKENVSDIRNSKVADLVHELEQFSVTVEVHDPHANTEDVHHEYGFNLVSEIGKNYDAVIAAVNHREYLEMDADYFKSIMTNPPILVDIKSMFYKKIDTDGIIYWSL